MRKIFLAAIKQELNYLRGRRCDCFMVFIAPIFAVLMICWVFSAMQVSALPIMLVDQDNSALSRQLTRFISGQKGLDVQLKVQDLAQIKQEVQSGRVYAAVYIDRDFSRDIKSGKRQGNVLLLHNAQLANASGMVQKYVQAAVLTFAAGIKMQINNKSGAANQTLAAEVEPIQIKVLTLFNPTFNYQQLLTINMTFSIFHILAVMAGSFYVGRMFRQVSLGAWLEDVKQDSWAIMVKLTGLLFIYCLPLILTGIGIVLVFNWLAINPPESAVLPVILAAAPFIWLSALIGAFFAALTKSQRVAMSITAMYAAPSFAFSGVVYPFSSMSAGAQIWGHLSPYSHFAKIMIQQLQMGAPSSNAIAPVFWMLIISLVLMFMTAQMLRNSLFQQSKWEERI